MQMKLWKHLKARRNTSLNFSEWKIEEKIYLLDYSDYFYYFENQS